VRERAIRLFLPWVVLAALVAASIVARALAGLRIEGLWIAPDEMIYGSVGRNLWKHGSISLFGEEPAIFGIVYPALIGGPLALAGLERGYELLKVIQPVVMSATAVPVYLWARRMASPRWSLVAAALTLAVPGLAYSGLLMSEVAFYPAVLLAAWAIAGALERPTLGAQAMLVTAILLAAATRLQALALPLVLVAGIGVHAFLVRDARRPLRLWPSLAALAVIGAAWTAWRALESGSARGALGAYAVTGEASYGIAAVARFAAYHVADVLLLTAFFPLCAVALLLVGLRRQDRSPALAAYLATAVSLVTVLVIQVGAFASVYVGGLAERTLLPLAPVLFVGFAAWLARDGPRPRIRTAVLVLAALGFLLYLPLRDIVVQPAIPNAFTVVPLLWLRERATDQTLELVVWGAAAFSLALLALLPRRLLAVLPVLAAGALVFASFAVTRELQQNVAFDQQNLLGGKRGWVDSATDEPVAYVLISEKEHNLVWQELFWNERIRRVYELAGSDLPGRPPLAREVTVRPDGLLLLPDGSPIPERLVVAPLALAFRGGLVDSFPIHEYEHTGLGLWLLDPPHRLSSIREGVRWDGDMYGSAALFAHDCSGGRLELTLLPKLATRVDLHANGRLVRTLQLHGEPFVQVSVPAPPDAEMCRFDVVPNSLLGSTRFEFVRD
jgi:hypothetical protein